MATKEQIEKCIKTIAPLAIAEYKKGKKILPSVCIAQACCESGYFTSPKMVNANAVFGIKVGKNKWHFGTAWKDKAYSTKTKECYDGKTYTNITDMFRAYDTIQESVEDYYDLLCNANRYRGAVGELNPENAITAIKNGGYATDPKYISTIISIIKNNNLMQYDIVAVDRAADKKTIFVGSARVGENGSGYGGAPGDQKQVSVDYDMEGEVSIQPFYIHKLGWFILRPKDPTHAAIVACKMLEACNNPNIGYNMGDRLGVVKHGISTKIKTNADCGTLVRQCITEATGKDPGNFTTANEVNIIEATGLFEKHTEYISQERTPIYNGDVLVTKAKGHTVIVTSGNPRVDSQAQMEQVESQQINIGLQRAQSIDAALSGQYETVSDLHLRYGPGKEKYDSIVILPRGTECHCYGYYTEISGARWLYVVAIVNGVQYTGFASEKYLSRL